jgi:hypothetical protein
MIGSCDVTSRAQGAATALSNYQENEGKDERGANGGRIGTSVTGRQAPERPDNCEGNYEDGRCPESDRSHRSHNRGRAAAAMRRNSRYVLIHIHGKTP